MHIFDHDISFTNYSNGYYTINISDNWNINNTPNGGYLMALILRSMYDFCHKKDSPILITNFISRLEPGPAIIKIERTAESKQLEWIQAKIIQNGADKVTATGTFLNNTTASEKSYENGPPALPPLKECVNIPAMPNFSMYNNMDVYLDPACAGWAQGKYTDKSEHRGYIMFKKPRDHDIFSIALCSDAFPPPVFSTRGVSTWVPTIQFNLNVRELSSSDILQGVFRTRFISHGICEEDGELWDGDTLIALSRQTSLYRSRGDDITIASKISEYVEENQ